MDQLLQRKKHGSSTDGPTGGVFDEATASTSFGAGSVPGVVQEKASGDGASASEQAFDGIHAHAAAGVSGAGGTLPHADQIAASFGPDHAEAVHGINAHVGGAASDATQAIGADAYATGNNVAFGSTPDLHTAAHEAAHVVQQKGGVQLKGGVGAAGDQYERNADEVADRVVQGKSASDLLDPVAGPAKDGAGPVQMIGYKLGEKLPAGAEAPAHGEDTDQRRYSVEQYEAMWEAEQGRKLTPEEKKTLARGCIGITANNLHGGGNPLQSAGKDCFGTFDQAHKFMEGKNKELHEMRDSWITRLMAPKGEYILFAKAFWSNQSPDDDARKTGDDKAFKPDPKTGRVDMGGYKYRAQPGYINFDYGFWDETSQSFWHANHSQPDMKVYQSTKDRFAPGGGSAYRDFDRVIFCVALAENYDPGLAAVNAAHSGGTP